MDIEEKLPKIGPHVISKELHCRLLIECGYALATRKHVSKGRDCLIEAKAIVDRNISSGERWPKMRDEIAKLIDLVDKLPVETM